MALGDDSIEVGRVVRTHGLDGELLVVTLHEDAGALLRAPRIFLDGEPGRIPYRVAEAREIGSAPPGVRVRLRLIGLDRLQRAEAWIGAAVRLERELLEPLAEDEIHSSALIGMTCVSTTGRSLGVVREIWPTPACDQLLIDDGERRQFVPARSDVVTEIDVEHGRIQIDLSALGLDEDAT